MRFFFFFSVIFFLGLLWGSACSTDAGRDVPDVSHIKAEAHIMRFEQELFGLDTNNLAAGIQTLTQKYPLFFPLYVQEMIQDPRQAQAPEAAIRTFLRDTFVQNMYTAVKKQYGGSLEWLETDLNQMFRYYKYYFPEKPVPQVVTMASAYGIGAFSVGDSLCGIGLDMFLGKEHPHYLLFENTAPEYIRRQYSKAFIVVRLAKALVQNAADVQAGERLLDQMLYNGKMLYAVKCLLPQTPDSLIMGYTRPQMEGCYANELEAWSRLLDQNLLYSSDARKLNKLVNPSPNAPIIFQEAPGEIGNWLGWRIVEAYMKRHPDATMTQLFKHTDAQKFLEASKYKPRKG